MEIAVDRNMPFIIKGLSVLKLIIRTINFEEYAKCLDIYSNELKKGSPILAQRELNRARLKRQVSAVCANGQTIPLDSENIGAMPSKLFVQAFNAINKFDEPKGSVISEGGDGVLTPIIYRLGTPFDFVDTNATTRPIGTVPKIVELEFIAKTGGDIEEVMCHDNKIDQTLALIKTCATPLGGETQLMRLPSWMISSLTYKDGFDILENVLPVFTE